MSAPLGDHFFRHEHGRLVAMLVRRLGSRHLEAIEDAVQASLLAAVESWPRSAVPDNPSAWLYRVAHSQLAGELRRGTRQGELAKEHALNALEPTGEAPPVPLSGDVADDLLRMLFVCCDDAIPVESQLVLARMTARQDGSGGILLLEEQDRSLWDQEAIQLGLSWLARSADGDVFSRYHAEAGIAAEHCLASSLSETRWDRIVACYELLERVAPSALHTLHRAMAVAEWSGPSHGLAVIDGFAPPSWLQGSYQWSAVLSDLHRRAGHADVAEQYRAIAIKSAPSEAIRATLTRRLR